MDDSEGSVCSIGNDNYFGAFGTLYQSHLKIHITPYYDSTKMLIHVDLKQNPRLTALDTPLKNPKNSFFLHVKKDRVIEL